MQKDNKCLKTLQRYVPPALTNNSSHNQSSFCHTELEKYTQQKTSSTRMSHCWSTNIHEQNKCEKNYIEMKQQ